MIYKHITTRILQLTYHKHVTTRMTFHDDLQVRYKLIPTSLTGGVLGARTPIIIPIFPFFPFFLVSPFTSFPHFPIWLKIINQTKKNILLQMQKKIHYKIMSNIYIYIHYKIMSKKIHYKIYIKLIL